MLRKVASLETIQADREKKGYLITADINPTTKKFLTSSVAFSNNLWGTHIQGYLQSIQGLHKPDMDRIIAEAQKFSCATASQAHNNNNNNIYLQRLMQHPASNTRARIPLNYDEDDNDNDKEGGDADESGAEDAGSIEEDIAQPDEDQDMYGDSMEVYQSRYGPVDYEAGGSQEEHEGQYLPMQYNKVRSVLACY